MYLILKCVLKNLVLSEHVKLDTFNSALFGFPYSPVDVRDKPYPISLKQSSGQVEMLTVLWSGGGAYSPLVRWRC